MQKNNDGYQEAVIVKIGIFDSGIGGLSLLHQAMITLPEVDYVFYADKLERIIKEELPEYNQTFRFGIGYGDLPLSQQGDFLKVLNAQRLVGLTVGKTYMMTPTKSVTAVIGLTTGEVSTKRKGCMSCNLKGTCRFRESGGHCNG